MKTVPPHPLLPCMNFSGPKEEVANPLSHQPALRSLLVNYKPITHIGQKLCRNGTDSPYEVDGR